MFCRYFTRSHIKMIWCDPALFVDTADIPYCKWLCCCGSVKKHPWGWDQTAFKHFFIEVILRCLTSVQIFPPVYVIKLQTLLRLLLWLVLWKTTKVSTFRLSMDFFLHYLISDAQYLAKVWIFLEHVHILSRCNLNLQQCATRSLANRPFGQVCSKHLTFIQNTMCKRKLKLHITLNAPSPGWKVVGVSCCGMCFFTRNKKAGQSWWKNCWR